MAYQPPIGSTVAFQSDPTKFLAHASVSGAVSVSNFPTSQNVSGSVFATGSVTALQGTNPWVIGNSSVQVVGVMPVQSVYSYQAGVTVTSISGTLTIGAITSGASIVGTYTEDSAHTDGQRGLFTLGVRNDMVTSFASADRDYTPIGVDSFGRTLVKVAPEEARVQGVSSTVNTINTSLIVAAGAGLRNYLTDIIVTNTGASNSLVNILDGDNSVIGRTIAPAYGGSNITNLATPIRTNGFNQQIHFNAGTASSIIHISAYGYKAP